MKNNIKKTVIPFALLSMVNAASASVVINEAMPCNLNTYMDMTTYEYSPYVEIFNNGEDVVNLNGYYFMYKPTEDDTIKEAVIDYDCKIEGGDYKLFFFDKLPANRHVGYKLDADGGELTLLNASGKVVSTLAIPEMPAYVSYGVGASGNGYMEPTPGKANKTAYAAKTLDDFTAKFQCAAPVLSNSGLILDAEKVSVTMSCATADAEIYYTTDGTTPSTTNGKLYEGALSFEKNTVIRARAYASGKLGSPISTASYIFNDKAHSYCDGLGKVPIVSIVTDKANFEDKTFGIGVKGSNGISNPACTSTGKANYNQDWKRPMNFEYIVNGKAVVNNEIEAKVMGGCSRSHETKSLSLSASKKCGSGKNKMKYTFFADKPNNKKYKSLHLRNGGNDFDGIRFRDGFMQSIIHGTSIDYQAYLPVAYYINGEYQGLMLLNEHANENYLYTNYDLDEEDVDFIKLAKEIQCGSGDLNAYNNLIAEAKVGQNTEGYYDKMNKLMDIEEYMTYMAFEQYIVNTDWPGNNTKIWRHRNNGRFRWILYDTDFGFGMYESWGPNYTGNSTDMLKFCLGEGSSVNWGNGSNNSPYVFDEASKWKTELFANLMKDETFKTKFLTKNLMLLNSNFRPEVVKAKLDSIGEDAFPEYCAMSANEHYKPDLFNNARYTSMKKFAETRPEYVYQHLASYYKGSVIDLNITSNVKGASFNINGLYWGKDTYDSKYISNNPITVTAIAPEGYAFKNWKLSSSASSTLLTNATIWKYLYEKTDTPEGWTSKTFKDSDWAEGNGTFGYGPNHYDTPLNFGDDENDKPITGYFRTIVKVDDVSNYASFTANISYDDSYILYINGKEISRKNISAKEITSTTVADDYTNDETEELKIDAKNFVTGENIIAVEVHQNVETSSDFTFGMSLKAVGKGTGATSTKSTFSGAIADNFSIQAVFEKVENAGAGVVLNEICTSNKAAKGYADEYNKFGDWIELYNNSDNDINVAGWYISDNSSKLDKYEISCSTPDATVVPAHGYKMIWCDNDTWNGPMHASFKLSESSKNTIILSKKVNGKVTKVDEASVPANLGVNNTYGRTEDGAATWMKFTFCSNEDVLPAPTPLAANGSISCVVCDVEEAITEDQKTIAIYPNPVHEMLNVVTGGDNLKNIRIYDNAGRVIMLEKVSGENASINTTNLANGIYHINVETENNSVRMKFIKK